MFDDSGPSRDAIAAAERFVAAFPDPITEAMSWEGWQLTPVGGGGNNRICRATHEQFDLAIKWTIRDARRRAWREHNALQVLAGCGLDIAPLPVLLDERPAQPVVVQTWLDGVRLQAPPTDDAEWLHLIEHLVLVHSITPAMTNITLHPAVLTASSSDNCRAIIQQQRALLPDHELPCELTPLLAFLDSTLERTWAAVSPSLCRTDGNTSNFLRRANVWASVDWEYSGWGDPAFEIAEFMTHPTYVTVTPERWAWVIDHYCALANREDARERIAVYYRTMLVWWIIRFSRVLYDTPRGADAPLVERPLGWEQDTRTRRNNIIERANRAFDHCL